MIKRVRAKHSRGGQIWSRGGEKGVGDDISKVKTQNGHPFGKSILSSVNFFRESSGGGFKFKTSPPVHTSDLWW